MYCYGETLLSILWNDAFYTVFFYTVSIYQIQSFFKIDYRLGMALYPESIFQITHGICVFVFYSLFAFKFESDVWIPF